MENSRKKFSIKQIINENILGLPVSGELFNPNPILSGSAITPMNPKKENKEGSASIDDEEYDSPLSDSTVKVTIDRDDLGCKWAYDNDTAVYNSIQKISTLVNKKIIICIKEGENEKDKNILNAKELIKLKTKCLNEVIPAIVGNKMCFGWCPAKKIKKNAKLYKLFTMGPEECTPIRNLFTGDLGGEVGEGLNPIIPKQQVALIQYGNVPTYTSTGDVTYTKDYFYFSNEDIIVFTNNSLGRFKGVSPVMRVLRLVEIKKTIENIVEMILRRFGPQIIITVGNEHANMENQEVPAAFMRDNEGKLRDKATAKAVWKSAIFTNIKTNMKKWTNTETLVQILEFGYDIKTLNPGAALPNYAQYISLFESYIKVGILGLFIQGRVDITSAEMQRSVMSDLTDAADDERTVLIQKINDEYVNPILKENGFEEGLIYIKTDTMDPQLDKSKAETERIKSLVVKNYIDTIGEVPKSVLFALGLTDIKNKPKEVPKPIINKEIIDKENNPIKKEKEVVDKK